MARLQLGNVVALVEWSTQRKKNVNLTRVAGCGTFLENKILNLKLYRMARTKQVARRAPPGWKPAVPKGVGPSNTIAIMRAQAELNRNPRRKKTKDSHKSGDVATQYQALAAANKKKKKKQVVHPQNDPDPVPDFDMGGHVEDAPAAPPAKTQAKKAVAPRVHAANAEGRYGLKKHANRRHVCFPTAKGEASFLADYSPSPPCESGASRPGIPAYRMVKVRSADGKVRRTKGTYADKERV
jgi:hypothetical protein